MYGLESLALAEKQEKVQVCKNNWTKRIVRVKITYKRKMGELGGGSWGERKLQEEAGEM